MNLEFLKRIAAGFQEEKIRKFWSQPWHGRACDSTFCEILYSSLFLFLGRLNASARHMGCIFPYNLWDKTIFILRPQADTNCQPFMA
jgi:hypothetical protein